jgi:hypothetical protein
MNSTFSTVPAALQPASETVKEFEQMLTENNLSYYISWHWAGWRKHGVIGITRKCEWYELPPVLDREEFSRASSAWGAKDRTLGRVRTGSPKHLAILTLYHRLVARLYPCEPLTPEQEITLAECYA